MPADGERSAAPGPGAIAGPERSLLRALRAMPAGTVAPEAELATAASVAPDVARGALQRLRAKRLVAVEERSAPRRTVTARGRAALEGGLPERRLLALLLRAGPVGPDALAAAGLVGEERSAAIGGLRRRGFLAPGTPFSLAPGGPDPTVPLPEETALAGAAADPAAPMPEPVEEALLRRGLIARERVVDRFWAPTAEGRETPLPDEDDDRPLLGPLTPALLGSGAWAGGTFRPYDVRAPVPFLGGARPHPYLAWLEEFEEILVGLGFTEAEGPLLETEFWNSDVLFMPQEHPARSIHDVLTVRGAAGRPPPADLLGRVAAVHEGRPLPGDTAPVSRGWRAPFDPTISARPVLRSQTTAVSARFLAGRPAPPFRMYCLDRNFRRESVDATHHLEFAQCEGVLGQPEVSIRHLVGVFRALAEAIGVRELVFRPGYFPFTEPSIEGYVRHPRLGWIEVFPGGLLRPEVLRPLGVEGPVAAWGIGVTRLAMVALGVSDIRELFLDDVARLSQGGG
ncbi:MAG TPA: phenylalanine--tRNA ligase subunit alpha [Thermoplasmata archaeon]|nr:phenylalanine--tRNA ligase subunit alpha [Thermoplasmata archaeon]